MKQVTIIVTTIVLLNLNHLAARDLKSLQNLKGTWKFSVGDDTDWASPDFDDSNWDRLWVPSSWESQGYDHYNGYAWYRTNFSIRYIPDDRPLFLLLGKIDDTDEVYLNGELIASSGTGLPKPKTAYYKERVYHVPKNLIKINSENVLAIRVYDAVGDGGIVSGKIGFYTDEDYAFIDYPLPDTWKIRKGNNREWKNPDYNDTDWLNINVPSYWEETHFPDYDGYVWYRCTFTLPANLSTENLYIILGRIDDIDEVYLNGIMIGEVFDLEKNKEYRRDGLEYKARRVYRIPKNCLKSGKKNVIAVQVYDHTGPGGIYEGPLGFATHSNYKKYTSKYSSYRSVWDVIEDYFYD